MSTDRGGVPLKLMKKFLNRRVEIEMKNGEVYTGSLLSVDDNLSVSLRDATGIELSGKTVELKAAYIRGPMIELVKLPESAIQYLPPPEIIKEVSLEKRGEAAKRGAFGIPRDGLATSDVWKMPRPRIPRYFNFT